MKWPIKFRTNNSLSQSHHEVVDEMDLHEYRDFYHYELKLNTNDFLDVFDGPDHVKFEEKPLNFERENCYHTDDFLEKFNIFQHNTTKLYVFLYKENKIYPLYNLSLHRFYQKLGSQYIEQPGGLPSLQELQDEIGRALRKLPDISYAKGKNKDHVLHINNYPIDGIQVQYGYNCFRCDRCCAVSRSYLVQILEDHYKADHHTVKFSHKAKDMYKRVMVQDLCPGAGNAGKIGKKKILLVRAPDAMFRELTPSITSSERASTYTGNYSGSNYYTNGSY